MRFYLAALILCMTPSVMMAQQATTAQSGIDASVLINQALDKQVDLEINAPLPKAMDEITQRTGVPLRADASVWDVLPWGQLTNINATIRNQTLRQALEAITRKLGLTFEVHRHSVKLYPLPSLLRLGHRATAQELASLNLLADTPADEISGDLSPDKLISAVDQHLARLKAPLSIENRMGPARPDQIVRIARHSTLLEILEELPHQTNLTWYPWGDRIVVLPKTDQIRMQLIKPITTRYNDVDVQQVLTELAHQADVTFTFEPGALQRIPPEYRNIRLILDNVSIRQALETIGGYTGLGFVVRDDGVYFWNRSKPVSSDHGGKLIGLLELPDIGVSVPIRDTDVSPELRQYIESKSAAQLKKLQEMMKDEGFKPTTQP